MAIDDETVKPSDLPAIVEEAAWEEHLPALVTDVIIRGGDDGLGAANFQARVLDKRTRYLLEMLEHLLTGGVILIGELQDENELDDIPTEGLQVGTAYFVNFALRVWNGKEWGDSGSLRGAKGLNLLGLWPDQIDLPEADMNEVGDAYIWRNDLHVLLPDDTWEALGIRGPTGASAFEDWRNIPGNEEKTLAQFYESQRGPKGNPGDSAYVVWANLPENQGKPIEQWVEETKGEKGDSGSNLKILGTVFNKDYLPTEDVKDQDAWITSDTNNLWIYVVNTWTDVGRFNGKDGTNGKNLQILGTVTNQAALTNKEKNDQAAWITNDTGHLWIYIAAQTNWVDMGKFNGRDGKTNYERYIELGGSGTEQEYLASLQGRNGTNGRNVVIKGAVATQANLPTGAEQQDAYSVQDVNGVFMWINSSWIFLGSFHGTNGTDGKSFVLKGVVPTKDNLPNNALQQDMYGVRDENATYCYLGTQWVLMGSFKGDAGKTSIEVWLESNPGKTEQDYWDAQKGEKGDAGKNLQVKGTVANQAALSDINDPVDQDAYVTRDTNNLWVFITGKGWTDLGPFKGTDGVNGKKFQLKGSVANKDALSLKDLVDQDSWITSDDGHLWTYVENQANPDWVDMGQFNGRDGKTNYQRFIDLGGTGTEEQYLESLKGKNGTNGRNVILKGSVLTKDDLPSDAAQQDAYSVVELNHVFMWINSTWVDLGGFHGTDGKDGKDTYQEWLDAGNSGTEAQFLESIKGQDGKDGESLEVIKILTEDDQTIPPLSDETKGKAYVDLDKNVWINVGGAWEDAGKFGSIGETGKPGASLQLLGVVPAIADLPPVEESEEGYAWQIYEDKMVYVLVDGQWKGPFDFVGEQGEQGIQGDPGVTVPIKDTYKDMAALRAAHPTGVANDAFMLENGHLVIWAPSINDWKDVGEFKGPQGIQGPPGEGLPGKQGKTGEQGSRWIPLPANMDEPTVSFSGREGDWCISYSTLRVYYKSVKDGWVFWGNLVSGDVNSPPIGLGKVVRLGDKWVPETIVDVPDPVDDKFYGRKKVAGEGSETEWAEIEFPEGMPDVNTADGKQKARVLKEGETVPVWEDIIFPEGIDDLTEKNGIQKVRVFKQGAEAPEWADLVAVTDPESPGANKLYLRKPDSKEWVEYKAPGADGKTYVSKNGEWISFDRYDLAIRSASATINIDASKDQVVALDNTTSTAKVISIANFDSSRSTTLVVRIKGVTGAISYGGTNIRWDTRMNNGSPPELSTYRTVLIFLWDGEVWTGNMASTTNA